MRNRSSLCLLLLACLVVTVAAPGCRLLRMITRTDDAATERIPNGTAQQVAVAEPDKDSFRLAPYVFIADFKIDRDHPIFKDLAKLRNQVYEELNLPSTDRHVYVYLFENEEQYHKYWQSRYPNLPKRRAYFVADQRGMRGEDRLMVFTSWSDRIEQDLRHELTHALLHSVLQNVPIWLDEGLAEYFELPAKKDGVNDVHLKLLARSVVFEPDLAELEKLKDVPDMKPEAYRESWAWVHWMLRGDPKARKALLEYLHELKTNANPGPLRPRLAKLSPQMDKRLVEHVQDLRAQTRTASRNAR